MGEPLKYKVEKSISAFIDAASDSALADFNYYEGQNPNAQLPPCIVVYCNGMRENFADALPKDCQVSIEIVSPMDADDDSDSIHGESGDRSANWSSHRAAVAAVETRMQNLTTAKIYLNSVNIIDRPIADFHLYDIQEDSQSSTIANEQRMLVSVINFNIVCETQDND